MAWLLLAVLLARATPAAAVPVVQPPFDEHYFLVDLGTIDGAPTPYGGIAFLPDDPDAIVIGAWGTTVNGFLATAGVTRDSTGSISGFAAGARLADATGVSGGVTYGPNDVLFYSRVQSQMGQVKWGSSTTDKVISTHSLVWHLSGLDFVPPGLGGEGMLKAVSRAYGEWYSLSIMPDAMGTYDVTGATKGPTLPGSPRGFDYVAPDVPGFMPPGLVVCEGESSYALAAYDVDENANPVVASRRVIVSGLDTPEGVAIDPPTGDVLFTTYVGRLYLLRQAPLPPTTSTSTSTSTSSTTTTSTTTTTKPTTSSTTTTTSTSTTTRPTTTTTTSTTLPTTTSTSTTRPTTTSTSTTRPTTTTTSTTSSTIPSTTSTTVRPTTTTTSSSTTVTPTTTTSTTTTIPLPCGPELGFESIACDVEALLAFVRASGALGSLQPLFVLRLERAQATVTSGAELCAEGRHTLARYALGRLDQQMMRVRARTRTLRARRTIPKPLAEAIGDAAQSVAVDARTLRGSLECP